MCMNTHRLMLLRLSSSALLNIGKVKDILQTRITIIQLKPKQTYLSKLLQVVLVNICHPFTLRLCLIKMNSSGTFNLFLSVNLHSAANTVNGPSEWRQGGL